MCLNNCIWSNESNILYDLLEIDCFNPAYEDSCDYIELDETCYISAKGEDLVFLQYNCCGLLSKQRDLSRFLYEIIGDRKVDVIALVKTWLTKESLKQVNLPGFRFVGLHRSSKKGGGVGLLIREEIKYYLKPELDVMQNYLEAFTAEIILWKKKVLVTSIYRPPNTDEKLFLSEYNEYIGKLEKSGKDNFVGLDHNLNLLNYEHHSSTRKFLELLIDKDQLPCITRPTRLTHHSATLIDNVLVSKELYPLQCQKSISEYNRNISRNKKSIFVSPTNQIEVSNLIDSLSNKNSSGWDGISNVLLKSMKTLLCKPLSILFNRSIKEGKFPDLFKNADVILLFKSGATNGVTITD